MKASFQSRVDGLFRRRPALAAVLSALLILPAGCKKRAEDTLVMAETPQEAATQLEQAFATAPPELRQSVVSASQALRQGQFDQAVVNLQVVRNSEALTLDQGLAVHSSVVAMEQALLSRVEAGDPNARRAYELLKALKRD
jgi:hypothetical protein